MDRKSLILVVEDNPRINEILIHVLEGAGFRVRSARSAMEGIHQAREEVPDLILADVSMPGQDGATAMAYLKDNPGYENIPLILVSGLPPDQLAQKMSECGAVDMIPKPFESSALLSSVRHWLAAAAGKPSPAKAFDVVVREISPGVGELRIIGAVGIPTVGQVEAGFNGLFERNLHRILVNLRETKSILSAGIGCFLSARETAIQNGGDLVFVGIPADVAKVFAILGVSKLLHFADTEASAVARLAAPAPPAAG